MHLLDFFIEVVNVGVDIVLELLLLILQLDHFNLLHFFIKLGHLLLSTLAVSKLPIVRMNLFFNLVLFSALSCGFLCLLLCFSLRLFCFLGLSLSLLLFLAALGLVLLLGIDFALFEINTILFDVPVCDIEVAFRVLNLLVNDWKDELLGRVKLAINDFKAFIQALHSADDVLLANSQVIDFDVEVNLDFVDGTFEKDHLLSLLLGVDLLALRHLVAIVHLQMILTEGASSFLNLGLFALVFSPVHDLLGLQLVDLLLSGLTRELTFFTALVSMGLVDFSLAWLGSSDGSSLVLILGAFVTFSTFIHVDAHILIAHLVLLASSNLALKDLLELIDIISEEVRHFGNAEGLHISSRSHGLDRELLEIKDVIELLLDLVELNSVPLNIPLFLLLCLFNLGLGPFDQHIEEVRVNVEVLLGHLNDLLDFLVLGNYISEAVTKAINLASDNLLLLLGDLELAVLFRPQLCLLD